MKKRITLMGCLLLAVALSTTQARASNHVTPTVQTNIHQTSSGVYYVVAGETVAILVTVPTSVEAKRITVETSIPQGNDSMLALANSQKWVCLNSNTCTATFVPQQNHARFIYNVLVEYGNLVGNGYSSAQTYAQVLHRGIPNAWVMTNQPTTDPEQTLQVNLDANATTVTENEDLEITASTSHPETDFIVLELFGREIHICRQTQNCTITLNKTLFPLMDVEPAEVRNMTLRAYAVNTQGGVYWADPMDIMVTGQAGSGSVDTTAPQVTFTINNSPVYINDQIRIEARATDASGIDYIDLYASGVKKKTCRSTTCAYTYGTLSSNGLLPTFGYQATDKVGNTTSAEKKTQHGVILSPEDPPVSTTPPATPASNQLQEGDIIRGVQNSSVYLYSSGKRRPFPSARVYFSWYTNFNGVKQLSDTALSAIPLSTPVSIKPDTLLLKIPYNSRIYEVTAENTVRYINNEQEAQSKYGTNWGSKIVTLPEVYFLFYTDISS